MPEQDTEIAAAMKKLESQFGSRMQLLFWQLHQLALSGQPCDITMHGSPPHVNVTINSDFVMALLYGAETNKLTEMLSKIKLSNGRIININQIWVIFPMPKGGFTDEELRRVDLSEGEQKAGPQGETIREMIRNVYHCRSKEDEDYYLRRYIAS